MTLTAEQLEELMPFLAEAFDAITVKQPPEPLSAVELGERFGIKIDPKKLDSLTLLNLASAVLELDPKENDTPLVQASYYRLVQIHAPWALK